MKHSEETWDNLVHIQNEAVYISHCVNTAGRAMHLSNFPTVISKELGRLGFFILVYQPMSDKKGKHEIQNRLADGLPPTSKSSHEMNLLKL